jgi:hypothetical protein
VSALLVHRLGAVLGERLVAEFTFVRPFARVGPFVHLQRGLLREPLLTVGALERSFSRVRAHMRFQYGQVGERFAAIENSKQQKEIEDLRRFGQFRTGSFTAALFGRVADMDHDGRFESARRRSEEKSWVSAQRLFRGTDKATDKQARALGWRRRRLPCWSTDSRRVGLFI